MGILNFLSKKNKRSSEVAGGYSDALHPFWYELIDSARRPAGQTVNATTAARIAAVFACQTAIKESIAMLPATIYQEVDRNSKPQKNHYLHQLLHDQPNPWMDSFEFFETMQTNALEHGNAYAFIERKKSGVITALTPLQPEKMSVKMSSQAPYSLEYIYRDGARTEKYSQDEIFHFKPHSKDGLIGRTPIRVAADTVGFSLALQEHGNKTFENGAFMSGLLKFPGVFKTDEQRETFVESFKKYMSTRNSGGIALLEQGTEYVPQQMNNKDAQFLEAREFSVIEIARLFRMPPVMIQVTDKGMSFASVEQLNIMFVQYTIQPWATRWERAIKRQLLNERGGNNLYIKFNLTALLRGDMLNRTNAITQQLQYGLLTINEARALEERDPIEEKIGDSPLLSHNLRPAKYVEENPGEVISGQKQKEPANVVDESAARGLITHTLGRIRRRELQFAKNGVKTGKTRAEWAKDFVITHEDLLWNDLTPVAKIFSSSYREGLKIFITEYLRELELDLQSEDSLSIENAEENAVRFWHLLNGKENGRAEA